ncbi:hypothetical protein GCM10011583_07820 [Streptomyces camponoticapitis]|uniref:Tetratricopeptide repeat protein n=1 Tax=Streptomyces camponoticapitis TaxID=1616125 RepID=A0ABQ2DZB2_9ACTN|nr:hypothetical protein [Streptomyces camponoticapitis]GGJ78704.1 hypothetical protein GCM10011583_07820 [Streptomyces camponoticapitis]
MTDELEETRRLIDAGDIPGAVRALRPAAESAPLTELADVVGRLAAATGFDDLSAASRDLTASPRSPQALYDFGYGCVERGVGFLAVPALREALRLAPGSYAVLDELVSALEGENRHAEVVALLLERDATLRPWPERYLLVFNSLLAGDLSTARTHFSRLPAPDDPTWEWAHTRVRGMLRRAELARSAHPAGGPRLDSRDLRGWHYVLTGGHLATLSPYGFDAAMTGRFAYLQDSAEQCRRGLGRLRVILDAAGRRPRTVSLLPGRSDRILGLAAAEVLGLPTEPYSPGGTDTVVVAYDLNDVDREAAVSLRDRTDGQVLYEHATCWTDPPVVSADVSGLLCQTVVEPWGERLLMTDDGATRQPPDARPEAEIAAEIVRADGAADPGDGETPPDPDTALAAFVTGTAAGWATGPRTRVASPGPVPSARFA